MRNLTFMLLTIPFLFGFDLEAQERRIKGTVTDGAFPVPFANIYLVGTALGTTSNEAGTFTLNHIPPGEYQLRVKVLGYRPYKETIDLRRPGLLKLDIVLNATAEQLEETVVTGTLKAVSRSESPVPVEVYSPTFLKKNPTANIFEALQNVNGVRPQINCNVCNTGDIHINGLEGPYTLVLIDGMPIVSGLGTVYGLSGIPNSLIEQIEIVKGPASSLYGSEAVGGLINIITKNSLDAPDLSIDAFATGWGEYNLDAGAKINFGTKTDMLLGVNYFNYDERIDNNGDNFTDLTLQDRVSVFQKWSFHRNKSRIFSLAGRYFYEDRWGGELQWIPEYRGGDEIYGESIYTRRWEVLGKYQLPFDEKLMLSFSYNDHNQNSVYGDVPYLADQRIGFGQLTWDRTIKGHDLLLGTSLRYNYYDDNTPATEVADEVLIPSIFFQDEMELSKNHSLLLGLRYDHDKRHGNILTPRAAYRWRLGDNDILRFNAGTGFRVVNLFTEEHAALTGARDVVVTEELKPERSINFNLNYLKKIYTDKGAFFSLDASLFHTRFSNAILPDYDTHPDQIIYDNLKGRSISQGISANIDGVFPNGLKFLLGATVQDVSQTENGTKQRQILTESFTGTWGVTYSFRSIQLAIDYTGNLYGPMRLPVLGEQDPRKDQSPTWSIQNIQFTYSGLDNFEIYGGIKNLLDWTPNRGNPFIIARANDPFDKNVDYGPNGDVLATADNPYALTFDPSYVYGPNQGLRGFLGLRYRLD
ncbi:TonB-dependent receptor [Pseudozobellia thermophila]|uniref:Outer membrane receptor for ferrienterochelin and colicins n=1 Tax=Pseudozobellia thermophila TaxID=192903 RepID=A0A1M6C718_9FLAO|nr:TonB-dependent receptor [Pseudozobellia thermophila]SHI56743.1 outer membrane receptor for ferrienterochelin and colicins [Pseudozobellia thermophila]